MRGYLVGQDGLYHADIPEPDDPGSNEVLIEVKAVSLNYRDLLVARGKYGKAPPEPFIAGSDMAGKVLKVGRDVIRFREGSAVLNAPFKHWQAGKINGDWMQSLIGGAELMASWQKESVFLQTPWFLCLHIFHFMRVLRYPLPD